MLETIAQGIGMLDLFTRVVQRVDEHADVYANKDYAVLGQALEEIHFGPDGVLPVLQALARQEPITDALREQMFNFNQTAPEISSALKRVVAACADREKLSLADREALRRVSDVKTGLRWDISQIANGAVNMGETYDPKDLEKMIQHIEDLNAAILELEAKLRHRGLLS